MNNVLHHMVENMKNNVFAIQGAKETVIADLKWRYRFDVAKKTEEYTHFLNNRVPIIMMAMSDKFFELLELCCEHLAINDKK